MSDDDDDDAHNRGVFSRLYDKTTYTGMYAERFATPEHPDERDTVHGALELRPSMNTRIQARERLATSPRSMHKPKLKKDASVRSCVLGEGGRRRWLCRVCTPQQSLFRHGNDVVCLSLCMSVCVCVW